jgi:Fe-Mn family superoxide dismutase
MFSMESVPFLESGLEGFLSPKAVQIHVLKHHQSYITTANNLIKGNPLEGKPTEEIIQNATGPLFNNVAQHFNHMFFWKCLTPKTINVPEDVAGVLAKSFGSFENFKSEFNKKASTLFGSGWCYLYKSKEGKLEIGQFHNAENPVKEHGFPLLTVDTWEHSWYVDYENRKAEYFNNYWNHINWEFVEDRTFLFH